MRNSVKSPEILALIQSLLWYNDKYQAFFSKHKTNNPQEYYWFVLDINSGLREHGRYRLTTKSILIEFFKVEYEVKYLPGMKTHGINMIQLINTKNELEYMNWVGTELPLTTGKPYIIN